jgi:hypothetical protein
MMTNGDASRDSGMFFFMSFFGSFPGSTNDFIVCTCLVQNRNNELGHAVWSSGPHSASASSSRCPGVPLSAQLRLR